MDLLTKEIVSEEKIKIRYSDIDSDKSLKPFSLLNFFQDLASDNAEWLGFGYSAIYPKNMMWVLLKYRIEFNSYPTDISTLTLKTEPRGYNKFFAYRNFELLDGNNLVAKASSLWSLVNFENKSLVKIEDAIDSPYFGKYVPKDDDLEFHKIPNITNVDFEKEFEVRYNDVDVNMHANNGNYIVWALEPLSSEYRTNHKLKNIDMMFKKEIKYGEKLLSQVQLINGTTTLHVLRHAESNEDLCIVNCEWI